MEPADKPCFETMATQYLGPGFPPHLSGAVSLSDLPPDTRGFVVRLLALMKDAQYSLTQFNPVLTRWLRFTIPGILPGAWEGRIPPITVPGRHQKLDDYLAGWTGQTFGPDTPPRIFLDIGCGFPPVTTADTAVRFPHWQIYGVDRSFADYVVYDAKGHYACFDQRGRFLYFQPSMDGSARALYSDPKGTKALFSSRFKDLYPLLCNKNGQSSETVEKDGNKLIHHHIKDFETDNLGFIRSDIMDLKQMTAQVIRCMNVFIYFSPDTRRKMLEHLTRHLDHKGLVIAGTNSFGIQSRYTVYQKAPQKLSVREFAFSLDNLGHIALMPWFTLHDNDPEAMLLAQLSATLRSTASFWHPFSTHLDQLLECHGLCKRKADGFLHFPTREVLPNTSLEKNGLVWQEMEKKGYAQKAVDILETAGHEAWINPAGDIAVRPPDGYGTCPSRE